eukprot:3524045-Prymnesium_polylepis.1
MAAGGRTGFGSKSRSEGAPHTPPPSRTAPAAGKTPGPRGLRRAGWRSPEVVAAAGSHRRAGRPPTSA